MKKILIVDDEIQILKSLERAFFESDYEICTAGTGAEALRILDSDTIDLIISDMRMPLMDGYELLSKVKELHPGVIRIILSGYADENTVFKAILHNVAKFYLLKPWSNEDLLQHIEQVFETEELLKSRDLLLMVNNLESLPTIEASYQKIINLIERDEEIGTITSEIEKDFSISSKLLQIANSAFYGVKTGSVRKATVYLGLQNLKSLIYSISILNKLNYSSYEEQQLVREQWNHALLTNKILHFLYEVHLGKRLPDSASSAGLLHNVGTLILMDSRFSDYMGLIGEARTNQLNILDLEKDKFNITHQEAGGFLISWWGLPFPIVEAALFHHRPLEACVYNKEIVAAVHIAQHYAWKIRGMQILGDFYPEAFDLLSIPMEDFEVSIKERFQ